MFKFLKKSVKSKTMNFGFLLVILSAVQEYLPALQTVLQDHYSVVTALIGVAVMVLRYLTSGSIADK